LSNGTLPKCTKKIFLSLLDRNTQWSAPRLALTQLAVILEWFRPAGFVAKSGFYKHLQIEIYYFLIMMGFATFLP
jgi:hypothetical protein